MTYEVGKFYSVPCVKSVSGHRFDRLFRGEFVPVIGPRHADGEHVGFPYDHWHVDWRFASQRVFHRASITGAHRVFFAVMVCFPVWDKKEDRSAPFFEGDVVMKRRKCMRQYGEYPRHLPQWIKPLEESCKALRMRDMVCPHQGLPLHGCPQDGDVVQCPGHGLRWNVKTGELVGGATSTGANLL